MAVKKSNQKSKTNSQEAEEKVEAKINKPKRTSTTKKAQVVPVEKKRQNLPRAHLLYQIPLKSQVEKRPKEQRSPSIRMDLIQI